MYKCTIRLASGCSAEVVPDFVEFQGQAHACLLLLVEYAVRFVDSHLFHVVEEFDYARVLAAACLGSVIEFYELQQTIWQVENRVEWLFLLIKINFVNFENYQLGNLE